MNKDHDAKADNDDDGDDDDDDDDDDDTSRPSFHCPFPLAMWVRQALVGNMQFQ